jgi:hypothetical protein
LLEINFWGVVPESELSSRITLGASVPPRSTDRGVEGAARSELRLRVLRSLPQSHERYLFREIRTLCSGYLGRNGIPAQEITADELVSEVWLKLVGTVALPNDEDLPALNPADWSADLHMPEHDGRIVWLIGEIGGSVALSHRHADVRRRLFGRGRATVQIGGDEDPIDIDPCPEDDTNLRAADARCVWRGLLAVASGEFGPEEDVAKLLRVLARMPDILEESSGTQWPVRKLVALLNQHFPPPDWKDRRVEDAKRRLTNWINRLMKKNALDAIDLEALFARVARQQESRGPDARREAGPPNLQS